MKKSTQSKSSFSSSGKKKIAVNSIFQAIFALAINVSSTFMNCLAPTWRIPTAHMGGKEEAEAHPLLCRYNLIQGWEERFCSWRCHMRLNTLHHVNFTEQSQRINSYREKNASQMFAKALVRRRICSKKCYSTTSSSQEQTGELQGQSLCFWGWSY